VSGLVRVLFILVNVELGTVPQSTLEATRIELSKLLGKEFHDVVWAPFTYIHTALRKFLLFSGMTTLL
jgi:hypothetical protein